MYEYNYQYYFILLLIEARYNTAITNKNITITFNDEELLFLLFVYYVFYEYI